jgi:NADPH:quinone reductase-like Zn-dependent oxidoreductase
MNISKLLLKRKAWLVVCKGLPKDVVVFSEAVNVPTPAPGEVLVKVQAAALNPIYVSHLLRGPC